MKGSQGRTRGTKIRKGRKGEGREREREKGWKDGSKEGRKEDRNEEKRRKDER